MVFACALLLAVARLVSAADDSKVKAATREVETGAKKIGEGKIGQGIEETAKGIGRTILEGGKFTGTTLKETGDKAGEKVKDAGKVVEPKARGAWEQVRDGAASVGQSVKSFFSRLFGS
ncbi:MAG: hypothetical protein DMD98_19700 [Candidatus Rokuibacteriota bacterium]|nr:MAG: hypothetical protein DMD98_19700 [Candidatus Rokubacteria bacterium]